MKPKTTIMYLLGAGASRGALPLANEMSERLRLSVNYFQTSPNLVKGFKGKAPPHGWEKAKDSFLEAMEWLYRESAGHVSVDTYAKKLWFLRDYRSLKKLKATLSAHFVALQNLNPVDARYDAFLATILQSKDFGAPSLPQHIRILTWNYDTQLEKAFYGFCKDDRVVVDKITFNSQIHRINGYCGTHPPGHVGPNFTGVWNSDSGWEIGIRLFTEYTSDLNSPEPNICFAWEDSSRNGIARMDLEEVPTVVVVGYSFPYFNREIDSAIFKFTNPQRVYLQYPEGAHESVEARLRPLIKSGVKVTRISGTDQFYIPDEFWEG